jgi:hypothetical protein
VVEADRLGSGATCANHGMLHSGALYVRRHGHIVAHCQQAHTAFTTLADDAELPVGDAVYLLPTTQADAFLTGLDAHRIPHRLISADSVPELRPSVAGAHTLIALRERVFSSRRILTLVVGQCLAAGVTLFDHTPVRAVNTATGRVAGVEVGAGAVLAARHVVLAAGTGVPQLLARLGSSQAPLLKSRLDMMIHLPAAQLTRGIIHAAHDRPVIMPAATGALTSFFGGIQPQITGRRAFAVDLANAGGLLHQTLHTVAAGRADPAGAVVYTAGKTDYVGTAHAENGVVNPGYHVIDHHTVDGLSGLYSIITGKMTLAFHASKTTAEAILHASLPLVVARHDAPDPAPDICAVEPWAPPEQL